MEVDGGGFFKYFRLTVVMGEQRNFRAHVEQASKPLVPTNQHHGLLWSMMMCEGKLTLSLICC